ncbi:DUF441 domain-containing protein [Bacillaceae bacterium Marseille-Q3522]|nr:DUF441 domain-containing protein [Bacillaceae bacterium Marseille-Q3522]
MFTQPVLFLVLLLVIGIIAKNNSLIIAVAILLVMKIFRIDIKVFSMLQSKGINWGITLITLAVLAPIASGALGFKELGAAFKSPYGWVALGAGILVAMLGKGGVTLLSEDPHITAALVFGTILAIALFKGVAVGPVIAAGIAFYLMKLFEMFGTK